MRRPESTSRMIASSTLAVARGRRRPTAVTTRTVPVVDSRGSFRGSLTAAAQALSGPRAPLGAKVAAERWQSEVWDLRTEVPELRFVTDRQAAACSQARLFIGRTPEPGAEPIPLADDAPAQLRDLSASMFGQIAQTQQQVFRAAQQLVNGGETEVVMSIDPDARRWAWKAYAPQEITGSAVTGWAVRQGSASVPLDPDREFLIRCYRPSPRDIALADAPVRSLIPVLRELVSLTKYISAQLDSRLAGAGLLLVPTGIKAMAGQFNPDGDPITFAQELAESMMVPLVDRDDASSMVPLVAEVDPQLIEKIKHVTFASQLDPKASDLREELIRRIGLGLDTDPSVLLGKGQVNHWSSWLIAEDETRLAVAPIVAMICHSLTEYWLAPLLEDIGGMSPDDAAQYQVWFDLSPLELRPDRSKDAQTLHTGLLVSDAANRRESGFGEQDAPDKPERERRLLEQLLLARPDLAERILPRIGIDGVAGAAPPPVDKPPAPGTPDTPTAPAAGGGDSGDVQFGTPQTLEAGPPQ